MNCLTCIFAKWHRTENDRLHPSGGGRCLWRPVFDLPEPIEKQSWRKVSVSVPDIHINRHNPCENCKCYVRDPEKPLPKVAKPKQVEQPKLDL